MIYWLQPTKYHKNEFGQIDWYYFWLECKVTKSWYFLHSIRIVKKYTAISFIKQKKWEILKSFVDQSKFVETGYYLIIKVVTSLNCLKHHHIKGCKGRKQSNIDLNLHQFEQIKQNVHQIAESVKGPF
jgi:hypothetical protein